MTEVARLNASSAIGLQRYRPFGVRMVRKRGQCIQPSPRKMIFKFDEASTVCLFLQKSTCRDEYARGYIGERPHHQCYVWSTATIAQRFSKRMTENLIHFQVDAKDLHPERIKAEHAWTISAGPTAHSHIRIALVSRQSSRHLCRRSR